MLIERHVDGRELAVSIIDGEPLPIVEAIPEREDEFNYEARYEIGRTTLRLPGRALRRRGERASTTPRSRPGRRSAATASPAST